MLRVGHLFGNAPSFWTIVFLVVALGLALGFECINGFHDTANAVATVIYTNTLRPWMAVVWSGLWNFLGVVLSNGAVAFGIVALLPVELVIHVGSAAGFAMVFSLLLAAVIWNFSTWFLGIPASSSHTLIGSIVGVGLMNAFLAKQPFGDGVNWAKLQDTFAALLISPVIGFIGAALLFLLLKFLIRNPELYRAPEGDKPPVWWVRCMLVLTCTGVSFAHGSNDGQKGMGLIMLILIGILPGVYAINPHVGDAQYATLVSAGQSAAPILRSKAQTTTIAPAAAETALSAYLKSGAKADQTTFDALAYQNAQIAVVIHSVPSIDKLQPKERKQLRTDVYLVGQAIGKMVKQGLFPKTDAAQLSAYKKELDDITTFIPLWVKLAVAICLGLGTMVGWKRIVVTVGEKIGKAHMTYAQGMSAEVVAFATIELADKLGLPVSTTHILTSGVAGTMAANRSGLQYETLRNIVLAWVLTVPACVFLGAGLFGAAFLLIFHATGVPVPPQ
ncbi:MAG: inorganic phosphate transporter [Candidatus Eremiobacteraeota bacterium]|nr:inorganic phosphate transporter [Candidatus Eremiobacteraeota bacterium]